MLIDESATTPAQASMLEQAAAALARARRVVCLTGAGVSAESGVSTFRDAQTGLWSRFDPQRLASQDGFAEDPGLVWRWYMERLGQVEQAEPNPGHRALAELERLCPSFVLATQNVDNLHERAGSRSVLHLHGRISAFHCNQCMAEHHLRPHERTESLPPVCRLCGEWVRPGVVWFGEMLPARVLDAAWRAAQECDVLLVVGTSGMVYPAAALPEVARERGACVIDVNPDASAIAALADFPLRGTGGTLLPLLVDAVRNLRAGVARQ